MEELQGYQCRICGNRVGKHEIGEHRELTGHDNFFPIYKEVGIPPKSKDMGILPNST